MLECLIRVHKKKRIHVYNIYWRSSAPCLKHSGNISWSLFVHPSRIDEPWEGRNIYIRERERETERHRERQRQRDRETETEGQRERQRDTERDREIETETERQGETETETERQREKQRDRDRDRDRERVSIADFQQVNVKCWSYKICKSVKKP